MENAQRRTIRMIKRVENMFERETLEEFSLFSLIKGSLMGYLITISMIMGTNIG